MQYSHRANYRTKHVRNVSLLCENYQIGRKFEFPMHLFILYLIQSVILRITEFIKMVIFYLIGVFT